jgi:hypothetical protein
MTGYHTTYATVNHHEAFVTSYTEVVSAHFFKSNPSQSARGPFALGQRQHNTEHKVKTANLYHGILTVKPRRFPVGASKNPSFLVEPCYCIYLLRISTAWFFPDSSVGRVLQCG